MLMRVMLHLKAAAAKSPGCRSRLKTRYCRRPPSAAFPSSLRSFRTPCLWSGRPMLSLPRHTIKLTVGSPAKRWKPCATSLKGRCMTCSQTMNSAVCLRSTRSTAELLEAGRAGNTPAFCVGERIACVVAVRNTAASASRNWRRLLPLLAPHWMQSPAMQVISSSPLPPHHPPLLQHQRQMRSKPVACSACRQICLP